MVMAVWGSWEAREDDPERAVRAALAMRQEAKAQGLQLRAGINSGTALVGPVGSTGEISATGDTVNVASRLQDTAEPEQILVSRATQVQVRGVFEAADCGPMMVRGRARPVHAYRVQSTLPRSFERRQRGLEGREAPWTGRDTELQTLRQAFDAVIRRGRSEVVAVVGEEGVGKSRLILELRRGLPEGVRVHQARAEPPTQTQAFGLLRDLVLFWLGVPERPDAMLPNLEGSLADPHAARRLGRLLGFAEEQRAESDEDPQALREQALNHLSAFLHRELEDSPSVLVLEDIHWADDPSLESLPVSSTACQTRRP